MDPADIPLNWRLILMFAQDVDPQAILAGGALRDLANGREIKDLDIFVGPNVVKHDLDKTYGKYGWTTVGLMAAYRIGKTDIKAAYAHQLGRIRVNTIVMRRPVQPVKEAIRRHDFGLCQIGYDGQAVATTSAFDADMALKQFTLMRADDLSDMKRSLGRYENFQQRYQGWPLIIPQRFKPLKEQHDAVNYLVRSGSAA